MTAERAVCFSGAWISKLCTLFHPKAEIERTGENGLQRSFADKERCGLYSFSLDLEGAKERTRKLVADGVGYDTPEMAAAVREYTEIKEL